ncbi:MAG: AMP-binding protein [Thermoguttaceae bacterium]|nr:AMP-binding protein [Thermoguttaceae bacterium]MDW8078863.1 AMP-binding protein [Thermoguttaceae bacterium]
MSDSKGNDRQRPQFSTLLDILEWQADVRSDLPVFTFELEDGTGQSLTFAELARRAKATAARLQALVSPFDRVLLVFPPGLDFVVGFFGCVAAGALGVPATYPKPKRPMPRLTAIAADCGARVALTSSQTLSTLDLPRVAPELASLTWICVDAVDPGEATLWKRPDITAESPLFLQYTSGSTSQPKGVVVTHRNLLFNLEMIREGFAIPWVDPPAQPGIGVFWLPAYHDMGLIGGILSPLYTGGHSVLMAPTSFLQRPVRWLRAISRYRALVSGGPNFGYELCCRKISPAEKEGLDLSCWQLAFCGAEPIRAETLARFAETFGPFGFRPSAFYPCYGLAEATLLATGSIGPREPRILHVNREKLAEGVAVPVGESETEHAQPLVGCGHTLLREEIRIVDPHTCREVPPGTIGEIWIKGPNVAAGYWNKAETNRRVFQARLQPTGEGPFLRTGDLGFLHGGELYVTGRLKEVIIIRGRNYYPQDIELTVQHASPVLVSGGGAAFSIDVDGEERLVVVQEVDRTYRDVDLREVVRQIRRSVAEEHDLDVYAVVLIRPASLPRTTSGKIQRLLCREKFLTGQLKVVFEWRRKELSVTGSVRGRVASRSEFATPGGRSDGHDPELPWVVEDAVSRTSGGETALASRREEPLREGDGDGNGKLKLPLPHKRVMSDPEVRRLARQIEETLLGWLVEKGGVDAAEIDRSRPFAEYGLDSLTAVELTERLEQMLNVRLTPTIAWNYPTPASLAEYLANLIGGRTDQEELGGAESDLFNDELEKLLRDVESLAEGETSAALENGRQQDSTA